MGKWSNGRRCCGAVYYVVFEPLNEILKCNHLSVGYRTVLSLGAVYYAVQGVSKFGV